MAIDINKAVQFIKLNLNDDNNLICVCYLLKADKKLRNILKIY